MDGYTYPDVHRDTNFHPDMDAYPNAYAHANMDPDAYAYENSHTYQNPHPDAHANPNGDSRACSSLTEPFKLCGWI